jgi:FG-GAP-like repeat
MMNCRILSAAALLVPAFTALLAQEPVIAPSATYPANLSSVQVADLNSDNAPEIIGLDNTSNAVVVLKNRGNGKYDAPTYYAVSGIPNGIAVGDFNGDGKLDVAVAFGNYNDPKGKVAVFHGNGDATLQLPRYYTVAIPANSIAAADYNNDNRPDIAVIGNTGNNGTNTVAILTNTGTSFTETSFAAPTYFTANGLGPDADFIQSLVAGDFNGDGRIDLAYIDSCAQCDVSEEVIFILANTTTGWQAKMPTGGSGSESLKAADIDGDGLTDLVIPYQGCHTPCVGVEVDYMKKDFTVASSQALDVLNDEDGPTPYQVVVGDFNNDGIADIAGYSLGGTDQNFNQLPLGIMMWTGAGNRTFHKLKYYNQPKPPSTFPAQYTAAGFVDKNGSRDLVVPGGAAGTEAQVWLNKTSTAADPCAYPTSGGVHVCAPAANVASGTVHFLASARTNTQPLNRIELWIDGHKKIQVFTDRLKIDLAVSNGTHTADFYEVGATGLHIKKSVKFTVGE